MAGRPRKPHRLRVMEGGRGKSRPLTPDLPAPADPLAAPRGLTKAELVEWGRHVGWIKALGLESKVDAGQVEAMVTMLCKARKKNSEPSWRLYAQLADKFGLSPTSRAKLAAGPAKKESAGDLPAELRRG